MAPRLVMTLLVSHEDDLVDHTLAYHLAHGVDFVVVTANKAPEGVLETVQRYVDAGRAHLIVDDDPAHEQARWTTRAARLAATEFGADWVINADADEFYRPLDGDLQAVFAAIPPRFTTLPIPLAHFVASDDDGRHFAERMTVREVRSLKPRGRTHLTKTAHRASPDVLVSRGSHRVTGMEVEPVVGWEPILGLHFPFRGYEQFERKVVVAGRADEAASRPAIASERNRRRYALYRAGRLPSLWSALLAGEDRTFAADGPTPSADCSVASALAAGRLVHDTSLQEWFAGRNGRPGHDPAPRSLDTATVERLCGDLHRALHEYECSPLHDERHRVERLRRRLDELESSIWWRLHPRRLRRAR